MRQFSLSWNGPYDESILPARAGLYCVWIRSSPQAGSVCRLVYIGESGDIAQRVASHDKRGCWERNRRQGEQIVFTYVLLPTAEVSEDWRRSVENCLIAHHRPPCNESGFEYNWTKTVVVMNTGSTFGVLKASHKCKGTDDPDDR